MKRLLSILLLLCALSATAAERITLTITITNPPVTGYSLTVNGSTRIWTNATTSTTIQTNSTVNNSTTNLFGHIATTPFSSPALVLAYAGTNSITLVGAVGQALTATTNGLWATLTLSTQTVVQLKAAVYPFASIIGDTNRTNQAISFVTGISDYATNKFSTNATALDNYVTKGIPVGGSQTITAPTTINDLTAKAGSLTNVDVRRLNFKPFGTGDLDTGQLIFYDRLTNPIAVLRAGTNGSIGMFDASGGSLWDNDYFVGTLDPTNQATLLNVGTAVQQFPLLAAISVLAKHSNTFSIPNYWTSASNVFAKSPQFLEGFAATSGTNRGGYLSNTVSSRFTSSNNVFQGSNQWTGDIASPPLVVTALADGTNILSSSTNWLINLDGTLTADGYLAGWQGGRDGKTHKVRNNTGFGLTLLNESGLDPTPTERFKCLGSSNAYVANGGWFEITHSNRWIVGNVYPLGGVSGGSGEVNTLTNAGTTNATRVGLAGAKTGLALTVSTISEGSGITLTRQGDGSGNTTNVVVAATGSGGTVTSVDLVVPTAEFTVSGNPITGSGTLTITKDAQAANTFAAGPTSGGSAAWAFRTVGDDDIPNTITIDQATLALTGDSATSFFSSGTIEAARLPSAGSGAAGIVSTAAQVFDGPKSFSNGITNNGDTRLNAATTIDAVLTVTDDASVSGTLTATGDTTTERLIVSAAPFIIQPTTVPTVTADNTAVTVSGGSIFKVQSNSSTSTDRTITLGSGSAEGHIIRLIGVSTSNTWELQDSGNCALNGTFTGNQNATLTLYWDGSTWIEFGRSLN